MASRFAGSLRLLIWLLLLRPQLQADPTDDTVPSSPRGPPSAKSLTPTPAAAAKLRPTPTVTAKPWVLPKQCGQRRIIGGQPAAERKWPWQVSLQFRGSHLCGGSLISSRWVMTAAHCIMRIHDYSVKLGDISLEHDAPTALEVPVKHIIIHKEFVLRGILFNDIALVLLSYPVKYSTHIQPVCLPAKSFQLAADTQCWVTGWGKTTDVPWARAPIVLQETDVNIVDRERCNFKLKFFLQASINVVNEGGLCAYGKGKDSCQGDSGGPLVCEFDNKWVQVGIVSWGIGCGRRGIPGIYTNVAFYKDWIVKVVSQSACWRTAGLLLSCLCLLFHLLSW